MDSVRLHDHWAGGRITYLDDEGTQRCALVEGVILDDSLGNVRSHSHVFEVVPQYDTLDNGTPLVALE